MSAAALLRRNLWIYGVGGLVVPFIGMQRHHVQHIELRIGHGKRRRDDGEVFRHIVGDTV
jgi:hypothetical protein